MSPFASAQFVRDVTIPDDTELPGGTPFVKTWLLENNGDVPWGAGYTLYHVSGVPMTNRTSIPLPACPPGGSVPISVRMTAPIEPGTYFSDWRCRDPGGRLFGDVVWVRIKATAPGAGVGRNDCLYLDDVTIEDDARLEAGTPFTKTWLVQNSGTLPWGPGYTLRYVQGNLIPERRHVPLPVCAPGEEAHVSLDLRAPETPGTYYADWAMHGPDGRRFGVLLWLRIGVPGPDGEVTGKPKPDTSHVASIAPHFSQRDARWRRDVLGHPGSPVTIGSWGCLLTCFAMLARAYGHDTDPARLNAAMRASGGFWNNYYVSWNALQTVYGNIRFEGKEQPGPGLISRIDASLAARCPVPVQVDRTPQTRYNDNDQHWVLVLAREGDDYLINDPIDLDPVPASLLERYGRQRNLGASVLSALFYRRAA